MLLFNRLEKELVRTNRVWETKLAIMQKKWVHASWDVTLLNFSCSLSFHALRDESFVRQNLQRQSTLLHYATVGYAVGCYIHSQLLTVSVIIILSWQATNTPSQPATYKAFHPLVSSLRRELKLLVSDMTFDLCVLQLKFRIKSNLPNCWNSWAPH